MGLLLFSAQAANGEKAGFRSRVQEVETSTPMPVAIQSSVPLDVGISTPLPVQVQGADGIPVPQNDEGYLFFVSTPGAGGGGIDPVGIKSSTGVLINPAVLELQEQILGELQQKIETGDLFKIDDSTPVGVDVQGTPDLEGKELLYAADNDMPVGSTVTVSGLGFRADLYAKTGACTFRISGGPALIIERDTFEDVPLQFLSTSPAVFLESKDASATCKVRLWGAN